MQRQFIILPLWDASVWCTCDCLLKAMLPCSHLNWQLSSARGSDRTAGSPKFNDLAHFYSICSLHDLRPNTVSVLYFWTKEAEFQNTDVEKNRTLLIQCLIPGNRLRYSQPLLLTSEKSTWNMGFSVRGQNSLKCPFKVPRICLLIRR